MKILSDIITSFSDINEYNSYTKNKYANPSILKDINSDIIEKFTRDNGYQLVSIVIKRNKSSLFEYVVENDIFRATDKGFVIGTLNKSRSYLLEKILKLVIEDGRLVLLIDNTDFKSFELGLLIDKKFPERGSDTMINFLTMITD